jgi:iron-sulfur cluster assembly protein
MVALEVTEKADEVIKQFLQNQTGPGTIKILRQNALGPGLALVLDGPRESDVTITVGDLTFAIDRDLLDKARPIRLDFVEFGGRKGFQLTSRLPNGGCG